MGLIGSSPSLCFSFVYGKSVLGHHRPYHSRLRNLGVSAHICVSCSVELPQKEDRRCTHNNSTFATVAQWADKISAGAGAVAGVSAALGLATAPTGAGFVGFESVAAGAALISTVASGVGVVANAIDGNWEGVGWDAAGLIGGSLVGRFASNAFKSSRTFGDLSASQSRRRGQI